MRLIEQVRIDSEYLPTIVLDDPFAPGPPSPVLQALKPQITLRVAGRDIVMAPYGTPGPTKWPLVRAGAVVAGAFVVGLMLRGALAR